MKKIILLIAIFILGSMPLLAESIKDVDSKDPAYKAIKQSVDQGYLSLFKDGKFLPDRTISRRELAIILDRIVKKGQAGTLDLTKAELAELSKLAKVFKKYLAQQDTSSTKFISRFASVEEEQKVLHYDISKLTDENKELKKKNEEQQTFIWAALGLGALGIIF